MKKVIILCVLLAFTAGISARQVRVQAAVTTNETPVFLEPGMVTPLLWKKI